MKIELLDLTVQELVEDYEDAGEDSVTGYGGKLDIRPPFQREFIYNDKERNAVIDSILKGFPLNVMYWSDRENGEYEIIDGQQRTISVAQYVDGDFSFNNQYFHNLPSDKQELILDYKLMVYVCSGTDSEKLEWFKTINIAGKELPIKSCVTPFTPEHGCQMPSDILVGTVALHIESAMIMSTAGQSDKSTWRQ